MTTIIAIIFWIASLQAATAVPGPQAPRLQVRATVSGTTVRSDATEPVTFVNLKLVPLDDPGNTQPIGRGGVNPPTNLQATSDAIGQFQFNGVIPGRYAISAEREGYVPTDQFLSGVRQSRQSILTVSAGSKVGIVVTMTPVPTISGTIYSPLGQRLAGATVQAYRVQYTPYGRQLVRVASVLSHEGGEYRLFRLTPGYYYVSASYSDRALRSWKSILELSPNLANPDDGYSTVYYPGELKLADAKVFNLYNGDVVDADISFKETRFFRLSVKVVLPSPQQPSLPPLSNLKVALFPAGSDLKNVQDFVIPGSGTSFGVDHLVEGDYVAVALADFTDSTGNTYAAPVSDTQPVRLTQNLDVALIAMDPFELDGRVVMSSSGFFPRGIQVQLVRVDPFATQSMTADVGITGQFKFLRVGPGIYDVFIQGMPLNAYLQGAGFPYADQRSLQIRIDGDRPSRSWHCDGACGVPVWMSDFPLTAFIQGGRALSGRVSDVKGGNVAGAEIVLVPTDPIFQHRRDRYGITYSDPTGAFLLTGISPGSYMAYAFESIEPDIYFDADFNSQISRQGTMLNISTDPFRPLERALTVITRDDLLRLTR